MSDPAPSTPAAGYAETPVAPPSTRLILRSYRDAIITDIRTNLVRASGSQFKAVRAGPRHVTPDYIAGVTMSAPVILIGWAGIPKFERLMNGQFTGPVVMVAHVVAEDWRKNPAHDAVMDLAEIVMTYIEQSTFGFPNAGPALTQSVEYTWDSQIDKKGYALASVTWWQALTFGRDIAAENVAADWPEAAGQLTISSTNVHGPGGVLPVAAAPADPFPWLPLNN